MRKLLIGLVTVVSAWAALYGASAGKVLDLGGTSGKSGVQTEVQITQASFTLECWVKMRALPQSEAALITQYGDRNGRIQFGVKDGKFSFFKGGDATMPGWVQSGYSVPLNTWVHLAFTQEKEGRWCWYVNGKLNYALRIEDFIPSTVIGEKIAIGNLKAPFDSEFKSSSLAADLSDVRVWNRARTPQEISDYYNRRLTGKEAGLIGYWRLDDCSESGSAVVNLVNGKSSAVVSPATGKDCDDLVFADTPAPKPVYHIGRSLRFNPSKDKNAVVKTSTKVTTTACTLECWVNMNSYSASDNGEGYFFSQYSGNNGRFLMGDYHGGNWAAFKGGCLPGAWTGPGVKIPLKKWTHLAFTQDADGLWTFYMDGTKVGTVQSDRTVFAGENIFIGNSTSSGHAPDACMSEARVWNYARSEAEIQAGMNLRLTGEENGLIGYWPLNDADGKVRNFVGGAGKEETMSGSLVFEEYNEPPSFEGLQGALQNTYSQACVATDLKIASADFTLEAWLRWTGKTDTEASSETYILNQYTPNGKPGRFFWGNKDGKIAAFEGDRGGWLSSDYSIADGVWKHCAYVHDAEKKEWRFYVDGVCVKTHKVSYNNVIEDTTFQLMGVDNSRMVNQTHGFPGMVRDLRIWNVARSGYEISSCRTNRLSGTESGLYAYFPMDEDTTAVKEMVSGKEYAFGGVSKVQTEATTFDAPEKKHPATAMAFDVKGLGTGAVPTDVSLTTADFTLETMVCWPGDNSEIVLATQYNQSHTDNRVILGLNAGKPFFNLGGQMLVAESSLEANVWTHLVAVRDSSANEHRLYADGRLIGSLSTSAPAPTKEGGTFTLGGYQSLNRLPQEVFKGYLSEFRVWSVARTVGEIRQNRYGRLKDLPELPANLTGYWPLDGEGDVRGAKNLVTGVISPAINAWQEFDGILPLRKMGLFIVVK